MAALAKSSKQSASNQTESNSKQNQKPILMF